MGEMRCFTCRLSNGAHSETCLTSQLVTIRLRDRDGLGDDRRVAARYLQAHGEFMPDLYKARA